MWIEPIAAQVTSHHVLAQEEAILTWALDAQLDDPQPSPTIDRDGLDVLQADAAAAVAGDDRLVVIVGPAGAGKTTMLAAAVTDLEAHGRPVFGVAPTAKAAQVLERETGMGADTVAKLLHEWARPDGPRAQWRLPAGTTVVVDEAGMLATPDLHHLTQLATSQRWRLALIGDPRQLQAVGRGGMFAELCTTAGRSSWSGSTGSPTTGKPPRHSSCATATCVPSTPTKPTSGSSPAPSPSTSTTIAGMWIDRHAAGESVAITTTTNDHVDAINQLIHQQRVERGDLDPTRTTVIADGTAVCVGDVVATRRNHRQLRTTTGDIVRNRELWTVTHIGDAGELTVTRIDGHGTVTLPADYVREHVRLGYAATEPGNQSATHTASITLATPATTGRGLYVAMTRGREREPRPRRHRHPRPRRSPRRPRRHHRLRPRRHPRHRPTPCPRRADSARHPSTGAGIPLPVGSRGCDAKRRSGSTVCEQTPLDNSMKRRAPTRARGEDRQRLQQRLAVATDQLAVADAAHAPFRDAVADGHARVQAARVEHWNAQRAVETAGFGHKHHARDQLRSADIELVAAEAEHTAASRRAQPTATTYRAAWAAVEKIREGIHTHDLLERWDAITHDLPGLQARHDALDTWQRWANGDTLTPTELQTAVTGLSRGDDPRYAALAAAIVDWSRTADIELHRSLTIDATTRAADAFDRTM